MYIILLSRLNIIMGKLTQKDLVNTQLYEEGIRSMIRQAGKAAQLGLRGVVGGAKEVGKALMPHTAAALGKIGSVASSAIVEIMAENPKHALNNFLGRARGRRFFRNINLGRESTTEHGDIAVKFKGEVYDHTTDEFVFKEGVFIVRPTDSDDRWQVVETLDEDGNTIWSGARRDGRGPDAPDLYPPEPPEPGPTGPPPNPRGGGTSTPVTASYSQKDLLRQLTLLSN